MSEIFLKIVNMSVSASYVVVAVLLLRVILRKAPRWSIVLLWGVAAVRLACPISVESALSIVPSTEKLTLLMSMETESIPSESSFLPESMDDSQSLFLPESMNDSQNLTRLDILAPAVKEEVDSRSRLPILSWVWIAGAAVILAYGGISYLRIYKKVETGVLLRENIYQCEFVSSPFVMGMICPKIYVPFQMRERDAEYVIAHEKAHICRKDHLWKPIGFLLLALHWFNPLVWIGYVLFCRDIELACDEKVIKNLNNSERADYSQALLTCSVSGRVAAACPLAFGEIGVIERVNKVLHYKKPAFWLILAAAVCGIVMAVCLLTDPLSSTVGNVFDEKAYTVTNQMPYEITLEVSPNAVPAEAYTAEGYIFPENQLIAYQTDTTTIYLKQVMQAVEDEEFLYLFFDFDYDLPKAGDFIAPYYKTEQGYHMALQPKSNSLRDYINTYEDAVCLKHRGPGEQFGLSVSVDVFKNAVGTVKIDLTCFQIVYHKNGEEPVVLPPAQEDVPKEEESQGYQIEPDAAAAEGESILSAFDYHCYLLGINLSADGRDDKIYIKQILYLSGSDTELIEKYDVYEKYDLTPEDLQHSYTELVLSEEVIELPINEDTEYLIYNWKQDQELADNSVNGSIMGWNLVKDPKYFLEYMQNAYGEGLSHYPLFIIMDESGYVHQVVEWIVV